MEGADSSSKMLCIACTMDGSSFNMLQIAWKRGIPKIYGQSCDIMGRKTLAYLETKNIFLFFLKWWILMGSFTRICQSRKVVNLLMFVESDSLNLHVVGKI